MKAIITGINGQDGYFMADKLLKNNISVIGLTSNKEKCQYLENMHHDLHVRQFDYNSVNKFSEVVEDVQPDLIFNFAARATGKGMFDNPTDLHRVNGGFVLDILEAIRKFDQSGKIFYCQASSSEMFGEVFEAPQTEKTPFRPISPYGAAKLYAHNMVGIYRSRYSIRACSAILYNHESTRRTNDFVTKKIATGAARISLGLDKFLVLGSLDAKRDWGYAPEYVDAIYRMSELDKPQDFILSTGLLHSVRDLCVYAFEYVGLNYKDYVEVQEKEKRINDSYNLVGDPSKAKKVLGWSPIKTIKEVMIELVDHELKLLLT